MINYYLLTKPGIIMGNLITFGAGFLLASRGVLDMGLFLFTLVGLALVMASGCVFNNYIDRQTDRKMERTKNRPLVTGLVSEREALIFASLLFGIGTLVLWLYTNALTAGVSSIGFFVYVVLYSMWKCHTIYATAIGSIAGAIPPVVGYCAVSNAFDLGALIFFAMMVLWQMPHFFAIAIYHLSDYRAANIPVLPVTKGMFRTKIHMVLYIVAFIGAAALLTVYHYTGYVYLVVAVGAGLAWLLLGIRGFSSDSEQAWGRQMFAFSLVTITAICLTIPFDVV